MIQLQWSRGRAQQTALNRDSAGLDSAPAVLFLLARGHLSVLCFWGEELIPNPEMLFLSGFATSHQVHGEEQAEVTLQLPLRGSPKLLRAADFYHGVTGELD